VNDDRSIAVGETETGDIGGQRVLAVTLDVEADFAPEPVERRFDLAGFAQNDVLSLVCGRRDLAAQHATAALDVDLEDGVPSLQSQYERGMNRREHGSTRERDATLQSAGFELGDDTGPLVGFAAKLRHPGLKGTTGLAGTGFDSSSRRGRYF